MWDLTAGDFFQGSLTMYVLINYVLLMYFTRITQQLLSCQVVWLYYVCFGDEDYIAVIWILHAHMVTLVLHMLINQPCFSVLFV